MSLNILIIDQDSVGLAFAWRCAMAGHQIRWWMEKKDGYNSKVGDGFHRNITKIENWVGSAKWADLIFTTSNGSQIDKLDAMRRRGINTIFGPSQASADLEIKRGLGMEFLEKHGVEVPEYKIFNSLKEAEKHIMETGETYVFKTLGDNDDKSLSYVGKSPADLIARLQRWQKLGMNPGGQVMLQKVVKGTEFAVSMCMGKNGWLKPVNEGFEHKKLMPGNYGVNTGEMGTVAKYVTESKLADDILRPLGDALRKLGHIGFCDLNCIIDEKGKVWPLEFTNRPGWPIFNLMLAATKGDPAQWMVDALNGEDTHNVTYETGIIVLGCQPNFPFGGLSQKELTGTPVYGVTKKNSEFIQPQGVMIENLPTMENDEIVTRPIWATAGDYLFGVTGFGRDTVTASKRAYGTMDELHVPNLIVRNDIGGKTAKEVQTLQKNGFATGWND
jgi:phosphoribosylamine---glycine ligase